ncbi:hypothetical protein BDV96DRAFT_119380 [Lophiotrema nucula]|uniref:Cora-like Mg2+ transporter protein-domain-containing protein n=1 Tax=Lophiotrema nucula TaxID=690887 RepID=A0A6A5Z175_9PLEO|nr:hypothetical protein BDV96DRAFT_119380 [Lophiotrema nucula]
MCKETENAPEAGQQWAAKLIVFPAPVHPKTHYEMRIHPFSEETRQMMQKSWGFNDLCFASYAELWAGTMTFVPFPGNPDWKGWLVRSRKNWSWAGTLMMTRNIRTCSTYALSMGLRVWEVDTLIQEVSAEQGFCENPMIMPLIMMKHNINTSTMLNQRHDSDSYDIQASMQIDSYYVEHPESPRETDLVAFQSRLTALSVSSAAVTRLLESQADIVQFMADQTELLGKGEDGVYDSEIIRQLRERFKFMTELVAGEQQANKYVKEACTAQSQMVYSLTAQRDNETNLRISAAMANESHINTIVARASLRYGLDMRIIAAVTLIFLPGTFVATFFSIDFFDFGPDNGGAKVSKWIWVYFVVTIVLTLAVLAVWRLVSPMKVDELELETNGIPKLPDFGDRKPTFNFGEGGRVATMKSNKSNKGATDKVKTF